MPEPVWCRSAAACLLLAVATGACGQTAPSSEGEKAIATARATDSPSSSPLNALVGLRGIAADTLRIAETGDFSAARRRVDDLERDWNRQKLEVKSRTPDKWRSLDAAIDRAERELRFGRVRQTDSVAALKEVVSIIDSLK